MSIFFLGKATVLQCIVLDLVLFIAVYAASRKIWPKPRQYHIFYWVVFYFFQLFGIFTLAPLQPEGAVIHLSGYDSNAVDIIPIIEGKADYSKTHKLSVHKVNGEQYIFLSLLRFKEKPREHLLQFGNKSNGFDITGVELFTTFFPLKLSVVKVPENEISHFFKILSNKHDEKQQKNYLHNTLQQIKEPPPVVLFKLTDELSRYTVWNELVKRAFLWSLLCTVITGFLVLVPVTSKLALQYTNEINRNRKSMLAYYYCSTLVVFLSFAILILFAEYGIRFYFRDVLSTASGINYFYNKSYKMFAQERNALKFRGKEFDFIKNKRFRIVILGDSISYGQGVYPYSLRYSDQVEKQMNISFPEPGVEVINLGTCGHDLPQHIHLLHFVKALHPDFVLYQWFINDMDIMGLKHETMAPRLINNHYLHKTLMNNSSLYFFVQKGWYNFLQRRGKILTYEQHMKGLYADENAIGTKKSNKALLQLLDGIKNIGVPYGIVLFPNAAYKIKDYPFAYIHARIMKICTNYGIPCLDLQSAYSSFDDHLEKLWVNQLDPHPSVLAHTIAAKNIMNYFGKRWQQLAVQE